VTDIKLDAKSYDFVIVGGGTAGCILASRLSEHRGSTVLLLEAGDRDDGPFFRLNLLGATFMNTPHHWNLCTQPEYELIQSDYDSDSKSARGRMLIQCRAKCLGGCSSLNLAIWHRGLPADYDHWRDVLGCKGWGWKDLEPYFQKCEGKGCKRNPSGFFSTGCQRFISDAGRAFEKACASVLNISMVKNFLTVPEKGVGRPFQMVFADGTRCNAVRAYLTRRGADGVRVCDRPNLTIATNVRVSKLGALDENGSVNNVHFKQGKDFGILHARREVILCGGTIHSPHLLMHSGIGPKETIENKCHIKCQVELPGVGKNLRDLASSGVIYEQKQPSIDKAVKRKLNIAKFALGMNSPLHSNTMDCFAFTSLETLQPSTSNTSTLITNSTTATANFADVKHDSSERRGKEDSLGDETMKQAHDRRDRRPNVMLSLQAARFPFACVGSYTNSVSDGQTGKLPNAFTVHTTLLQPKSGVKGGQVAIASSYPFFPPTISHGYLSHEEDIKRMVEAIKVARKVVQSKDFDLIRGRELLPGPSVQSDKEIEMYIRRSACHFFGTIVGTCKMGIDENAVVDTSLRVRKTNNLRVVDASVIPSPTTGFNHSTVAAIAEKAADIIKKQCKLR